MAIIIKKGAGTRKMPSPVVANDAFSGFSQEDGIRFMKALARECARRDHALAISQGSKQ